MSARKGYMSIGLAILLTITVTVQSKSVSSITEAQRYLSRYGYLPNGGRLPVKKFKNAMQKLQSFAGLSTTGKLDKQTVELMSLPRCGVPDTVGLGNDYRSERYELEGSRWPQKNLTYKILNYPSKTNMERPDVDAEIARAFTAWSNYSSLTFSQRQSGAVHIEIKFAEGEHGDEEAFDGPGGILAHAHFPNKGGSTHFDNAETWTMGSYQGYNLFETAVHEIGHALGLVHSKVQTSIMAPFYRNYTPNFRLERDDINGIQALYGKRPPKHQLCADPKIDAILNLAEGEMHVFQRDVLYKFNGDSMADGYPKNISDEWAGLPSNIDGAIALNKHFTLFYKGDQVWRYINKKLTVGFPKSISGDFGLRGYFDAVMYRSNEKTIYFFKGREYWTLDVNTKLVKNDFLYKKYLPSDLDAAFEDENGYAYFFKDDNYYRLDDATGSVDVKTPPKYPRPTSEYWFGC